MSATAQISWDAQPPAGPQIQWDEENPKPKRTTADNPIEKNAPSMLSRVASEAAALPARAVGIGVEKDAGTNWVKSNVKMAADLANPMRVGAPQVVKDIVHGMDDTSREGEMIARTGRSVERAAPGEAGAMQSRPGGPVFKSGAELEHPQAASWIRKAASFAPVVGPAAVRAGHELATGREGDTIAGVADAAAVASQTALMTKGGQEAAERAVTPVVRPVARGVTAVGRAGYRGLIKGEPPKALIKDAPVTFKQAIQPGVNVPKGDESIAIAGPRMQQVMQERGMNMQRETGDGAVPVTKKGLDVVKAAKETIYDAIDKRLGPVAELSPDTKPVGDAIRGTMDKVSRRQFPEVAAKLDERAAAYDGNDFTLRDIENRIQRGNVELAGHYNQTVGKNAGLSWDGEATKAELTASRKLLDQKIKALTGNTDITDLKREYGALRDVERSLAKQHAISTRVKDAGLWEGLAYLHAAGDLISGNALGAAKAGGVLAIGKMLKNMRDPNWLLEQSFHGPKAFQAAKPIAASSGPPAPAGLLTEGPKPAGWNAEDASGTNRGQSGRWTTPAAQLPDQEPIKPTFIREIPKTRPGTRTPIRGLLTSGEKAASTTPPAVEQKFAAEKVGGGPNWLKTASEPVTSINQRSAQTGPKELPGTSGPSGKFLKAARGYKPSEKAETMSAPAKKYGPEFEAQQAQEEINRSRAIQDDPKASDEVKAVASERLRDAKKASREVAPTEGERRSRQEENELRGEITRTQQKIRATQDKMGRAKSYQVQRDAMDALQVHERRLAELKEALEKGTPIKLGLRGATKDELTETYRGLEGEEKEQAQTLLEIYQKTEGPGRQEFIDHYALNRGDWKGLPITEKMARVVKGQKSSAGRMMRSIREPGEGDVPF